MKGQSAEMKATEGAPVEERLRTIVTEIYDSIERVQVPYMTLPARTKSNIVFSKDFHVWKYGRFRTKRSAILETWTRPSCLTPMSTKAPKFATFVTTPSSSMPATRSLISFTSSLKVA